MKFEPGRAKTGGRREGVANRATAEFKEFCQQFLESAEYRANLQVRILTGRADHMEKYMAELLHGRPKQLDLSKNEGVTIIVEGPDRRNHTGQRALEDRSIVEAETTDTL